MNLTIKRNDASYEVLVAKGLLERAGTHLDLSRKVLVVTDSGVPRTYVQKLLAACKESVLATIPAGEEHKNFATYENLLKICIATDLTRSDCVIALGGGMVCDLAGFLAATYLRGVDFYSIPTTLLAMADASVGGKTGLDFEGYKNQVGAFYQPKKVLIDPDLLATLDERHLSCGYAEIIKMALALDEGLLNRLERKKFSLERLIRDAVALKGKVVAEDERESDLRRVLNFGHTVGHAIESASEGSLLHGECIALGMIPMCSSETQTRLLPLLEAYGLPTRCDVNPEAVISAIARDKKRGGDTVTIVFVEAPGSCELRKIPLTDLYEMIRRSPIFGDRKG